MAVTTPCAGFFADRITRLKFEREKQGLTQAALARVAWLNSSELSKMERGRTVPYEEQARRIAAALGWEGSLEELFEPIDAGEAGV